MVVALLPGAGYIWSFERVLGRWGVGLSDRLVRFIGASAVFHVVAAPATYWFWSERWPTVVSRAEQPWWMWALVAGYLAIPAACGSFVAQQALNGRRWTQWVTGPHPAPRAWDHLFQNRLDGLVRLKLASGPWIGGVFSTSTDGLVSYAAGYPEDPDLFVATAAVVDSATGEFLLDERGSPVLAAGSVLVRWGEVEYLEFIDAEEMRSEQPAC